ncbi:Ribosomal protein L5 [Gossypium australe]|uniref:Ribosomal protein L5 n=1 Tax=Gossypium australe TaxID=47621 RepID=A0A5B6UDZ9_9ROSI|nr:Ribosomal protein L5 [Gossypium australe]
MDKKEMSARMETSENLCQVVGGVNGHLKNLVNGVVSETIIVQSSKENVCFSGENAGLRFQNNGLGSCTHQEVDYGGGIGQPNGVASETVIVVDTTDATTFCTSDGVLESKDNGLDSSKVLADMPKTKAAEEEDVSMIDIKGTGGVNSQFKECYDGESLCRICHLNSEQSLHITSTTAATMELIQIGCGCKDELGIAHSHCAEAWFNLKGNRLCEICGQTVGNIIGVKDNGFIENWHHQGSTTVSVRTSDQGPDHWRGQPFCNFLLACLVIAFVLPLFFHVNMF